MGIVSGLISAYSHSPVESVYPHFVSALRPKLCSSEYAWWGFTHDSLCSLQKHVMVVLLCWVNETRKLFCWKFRFHIDNYSLSESYQHKAAILPLGHLATMCMIIMIIYSHYCTVTLYSRKLLPNIAFLYHNSSHGDAWNF